MTIDDDLLGLNEDELNPFILNEEVKTKERECWKSSLVNFQFHKISDWCSRVCSKSPKGNPKYSKRINYNALKDLCPEWWSFIDGS